MRKKRIIPFLLAAAMILSLIPVGSLAAEGPTVAVEATLAGDTVTATVRLSENSGVTNGRIVLEYDKTMLTLKSADAGALLSGTLSDVNTDTAGKVSLAWVGQDPLTNAGALLTAEFTVKLGVPLSGIVLTPIVRELYADTEDLTGCTTVVGATLCERPAVILEAVNSNSRVTLNIWLAGAAQVTNGKIFLDYDNAKLTYIFCNAAPIGVVSINDAAAVNRVSIAWVGSRLTNEKTLLATLEFKVNDGVKHGTMVVFTPNVHEMYIDGTKLQSVAANPLEFTLTSVPPGNVVIITPPPGGDTQPDQPDEFENPYIDIDNHWAYKDIIAATKAGLFSGRTENTFVPEGNITRAEFVTVLWRLSEKPAPTCSSGFTDISGQWFEAAVEWAAEAGITKGSSPTKFDPNANITREMMATMLCRYAAYTGRDVSAVGSLSEFKDASAVSSWALSSMQWAVAEQIISGSNGSLLPKNIANRAQTATILCRYAGIQ